MKKPKGDKPKTDTAKQGMALVLPDTLFIDVKRVRGSDEFRMVYRETFRKTPRVFAKGTVDLARAFLAREGFPAWGPGSVKVTALRNGVEVVLRGNRTMIASVGISEFKTWLHDTETKANIEATFGLGRTTIKETDGKGGLR